MAEAAKPIFGYWSIRCGPRGNVNRNILNYAGVDYTEKIYDVQTEEGRAEWANDKANLGIPFPNIPYIIDGDLKLSESKAVTLYICEKWAPELLGANPAERGHILML